MLLEMSKSTGYSVGDLNLIFTFFTVGSIIGQLTSIFYNRKFRKFNIIFAGYAIITPCLITLSLIKALYLFYLLYFVIGYITGVIFIQTTKYVLENRIKNKDRLITILFNSYIVGYWTAPFIAYSLISNVLVGDTFIILWFLTG